jgi:hypothetical protein
MRPRAVEELHGSCLTTADCSPAEGLSGLRVEVVRSRGVLAPCSSGGVGTGGTVAARGDGGVDPWNDGVRRWLRNSKDRAAASLGRGGLTDGVCGRKIACRSSAPRRAVATQSCSAPRRCWFLSNRNTTDENSAALRRRSDPQRRRSRARRWSTGRARRTRGRGWGCTRRS